MAGKASSGWYPDPQNPQQVRFWDGYSWTDQTRMREDAPPMDTRDPWSSASQARLGASNPTGFTSTSGLSPAEASVQSGMPAWTWVVISLAAVAMVGGVVWVIWFAASGQATTASTHVSAPQSSEAPLEDSSVPTGDATIRETLNGTAVFEVPAHWYEDSGDELSSDPSADGDLTGTWNVDGKTTAEAQDFIYVWEYFGEDLSDELTIEELGLEYYDYWGENITRTGELTETLTTAGGYEAWRQSVMIEDGGEMYQGLQYVVRSGGAELAFVLFAFGNPFGYDTQIREVVDSVDFLVD